MTDTSEEKQMANKQTIGCQTDMPRSVTIGLPLKKSDFQPLLLALIGEKNFRDISTQTEDNNNHDLPKQPKECEERPTTSGPSSPCRKLEVPPCTSKEHPTTPTSNANSDADRNLHDEYRESGEGADEMYIDLTEIPSDSDLDIAPIRKCQKEKGESSSGRRSLLSLRHHRTSNENNPTLTTSKKSPSRSHKKDKDYGGFLLKQSSKNETLHRADTPLKHESNEHKASSKRNEESDASNSSDSSITGSTSGAQSKKKSAECLPQNTGTKMTEKASKYIDAFLKLEEERGSKKRNAKMSPSKPIIYDDTDDEGQEEEDLDNKEFVSRKGSKQRQKRKHETRRSSPLEDQPKKRESNSSDSSITNEKKVTCKSRRTLAKKRTKKIEEQSGSSEEDQTYNSSRLDVKEKSSGSDSAHSDSSSRRKISKKKKIVRARGGESSSDSPKDCCKVCHEFKPKRLAMLHCQHVFCLRCVQNLLENKEPCPNCNRRFRTYVKIKL